LFRDLGRHIFRFRWAWITGGIVTLALGVIYGANVFSSLKSGGLDDPASSSSIESQRLQDLFPKSRVSLILLASSNSQTVGRTAFRLEFLRLCSIVAADPAKPFITSYYSTHSAAFVSKDLRQTFALIGVSGDQDATYLRLRQELHSSDLHLQLGGPAAADYELNAEVQRDLPKLGAISLPLLAILLLFIFRSATAALLPLLIGAVSVLGAFALTRVLTSFIDISVFAANIISLLGLGLAIDYSLLFVSRFRDELIAGATVEKAIATCTATAGSSIFLSGITVILSLLGLLVFPEMFLRSMGIGGALAVASAVASSLTVLPALLSVLGHKVNSLMLPLPRQRFGQAGQETAWRSFGAFVVKWPTYVLLGTLAVLFIAGEPFLHVKFANPGIDTLPASFQSRLVADTIARNFPHSQNPQIEILATMEQSPISPSGIAQVNAYAQRLRALLNVVGVNGLTGIGHAFPDTVLRSLYDYPSVGPAAALTAQYLNGRSTFLTIDYRGATDDLSTQALVRAVRNVPLPVGADVVVGGQTAELVDRLDSLRSHLPVAIAIIFVATFIVLLVMLSSIVIPIKAILLNTLSLSAAFGLMTWIFQDGHLHRLLQFTPSGSLDPTLPVLIFAIAFGLATDYEVFLVSRIKEEYERSGDNSEAVIIGVEKTGGVITSAGLLLVVVVAAFGMSDILSMKEMGVGLAIAVAVDAAVVRTLLVPAAMQLFGRLNWWMPGKTMLLEME
jgi:uncharacterized membrane protein YdfJ with MMPL/SSD domain